MPVNNTERKRDLSVTVGLMITAMLAGSIYAYRGGMSEPDSVVMAAGMARMAAGEPLIDCMLYGRYLNPGIYFLFRLVHPLFVKAPGDTIPFLNILGVLSFTLFSGLFYRLLRRRFDRTVAACCALITMLTPVFWESGTYFHPVVPALALIAGAILLSDRIANSPGGITALAAVIFLAAAATMMRNEVLLAAPALLAAAVFSGRPGRNISLVTIITLISAVAFMAVSRAVTVDGEGGTGFFGRFSSGLTGSVSLRGMTRTVPWAVMALGTASVIAVTWGILSRLRERNTRALMIPALLWAVPAAAWLLWPVPVLRHYFVAVPAIVYLLASTILLGKTKRAVILITAALIVLNLGLPELLYRSYNSFRPDRAKEPHGTFFYRHSLVRERIERYSVLQDEIAAFIGPGHDRGSRHAVIPVNWEVYGYSIYTLAGRAERAGEENDPAAGIDTYDFNMWGRSIRLLRSNRFDLDLIGEEMLQELGNSTGPGSTVMIPEELLDETEAGLPARTRISTY